VDISYIDKLPDFKHIRRISEMHFTIKWIANVKMPESYYDRTYYYWEFFEKKELLDHYIKRLSHA